MHGTIANALGRFARYCVKFRHRWTSQAEAIRLKPVRLRGAPSGVTFVAVGSEGRIVILKDPLKKPRARTWKVRRTGGGGAGTVMLERTCVSHCVSTVDFGLCSAVVTDENNIRHFFGKDDNLDGFLEG